MTTVLNELLGWSIEHIPENWTIQLSIYNGECCIVLLNSNEDNVDFCSDDCTPEGTIVEAVNHARNFEGLPCVSPIIPGIILNS